MTQAKHTPGPWRVGTAGPNGCYTVGTKNGLMTAMVAHSVNHESQREQAIGDANLIAAAPELYEALADLVYQVNRPDAPAWLSLDDAFAAIAKATGA